MCIYKLAECGVIVVDVAQDMLRIRYIIYGYGRVNKKSFVYTGSAWCFGSCPCLSIFTVDCNAGYHPKNTF